MKWLAGILLDSVKPFIEQETNENIKNNIERISSLSDSLVQLETLDKEIKLLLHMLDIKVYMWCSHIDHQ